ncbi:hypothetical protein Thi970DRAFT_04434 [Thiorhodovibrio frisius]|uniref:Uncharacterized protein n=2 Tax=Thiorhodovibrio frisius TaxID=631362 RepID=H8Z6R2_9GAMM|nr:hypothetical protein Thi970DRAFT_04434 [Thiorhodovibrio frisius]WPL21526.1 hypothetical protein Thiofri_01652 [Thiorhodovibrio frisius]
MKTTTHISRRAASLAAVLAAFAVYYSALSTAWAARLDNAIDPSGSWRNAQGSLALMLTGDALSFSYSSVFGPAAHICDGAGVAGLVGNGLYHFVDDQGTLAIQVTEDGVRMEQMAGVLSFCGANWPGERFSRDGFAAAEEFRVITAVSHFYTVMLMPPILRQAYVVQGDVVQTVPTQHGQAGDYVLARYIGTKATTVGLIKTSTLQAVQPAHQQSGILFIRGEYQAIREALPLLTTEQADISDLSTEGGEATAYRDVDGRIRLIELSLYFDTGMIREEFYFSEGSLIFVLRARHQYNAPFYLVQEEADAIGVEAFDAGKTRITEDRFYFQQGKMIRWLDDHRKAMAAESPSFEDNEKELQARASDLLSRFDPSQ